MCHKLIGVIEGRLSRGDHFPVENFSMRMNRRVPVGVSLFITEVVLPDEVRLEVKKCENWKSPSMTTEVPRCLSVQGVMEPKIILLLHEEERRLLPEAGYITNYMKSRDLRSRKGRGNGADTLHSKLVAEN